MMVTSTRWFGRAGGWVDMGGIRIKARIIDDITSFIFVRDEMQPSDIIFIPGGSHPELGEHAAALYKKGLANMIMPTGGFSVKTGCFNGVKSRKEIYSKAYVTECEFLTDVLRINGVPGEAIIGEDQSGYTKENADFARIIIDEKRIPVKKAILCCKSFHARRVLMYFQLAFPEVDFLIYPVPYEEGGEKITSENWHRTEVGIRRVMGEIRRVGDQFYAELIKLK